MKDIKGRTIKKGDDVLIIEEKRKVPGTVLGVGKTKIKLQLREGILLVNQDEVKLQKIVATGGLQENRRTTGLLIEIFKDTKPQSVVSSRDNIPGIGLDTLRFFGVGFDKHHPAMRLTEEQRKYNTYGKIYRLLKEAFDEAYKDEELNDVAKAIAEIASYLNKKMEK